MAVFEEKIIIIKSGCAFTTNSSLHVLLIFNHPSTCREQENYYVIIMLSLCQVMLYLPNYKRLLHYSFFVSGFVFIPQHEETVKQVILLVGKKKKKKIFF